MAKYKVTVGEPFGIDGVEIEEIEAVERLAAIDERRVIAREQSRLTYLVIGVMLVAMTVASVIGWLDGSYNELYAVWAAGSFWVGLVLGRYFKKE